MTRFSLNFDKNFRHLQEFLLSFPCQLPVRRRGISDINPPAALLMSQEEPFTIVIVQHNEHLGGLQSNDLNHKPISLSLLQWEALMHDKAHSRRTWPLSDEVQLFFVC